MMVKEYVDHHARIIKSMNRNGNNVYVKADTLMMAREDADLSAQTIKFTNLNGSNVFV